MAIWACIQLDVAVLSLLTMSMDECT
jgi:hypothetical protein